MTGLLERWIGDEFGSIEAQYGRQTRSLADGEKMLNELVEMRLRGLIDDALFSAKRRQLEEEVGGLRLAVGRTQERLDRVRATVHAALDFRQRARAQFLAGDLEKRREIARALGVRYVVTEGKVFIEMNPLLAYQQDGAERPATPATLGAPNRSGGPRLELGNGEVRTPGNRLPQRKKDPYPTSESFMAGPMGRSTNRNRTNRLNKGTLTGCTRCSARSATGASRSIGPRV